VSKHRVALTKTSPPSRESPLGLGKPTRRNAQAGSNKETGPPSRESLWTAGDQETNASKCAGRSKQRNWPTVQRIPLDGWRQTHQRVKTREPVRTKKLAHHPENPSGQLEIKKPTRRNAQAGSNKETGPPPGESLQMAGKKQESEIKNTTLYYTTLFFFWTMVVVGGTCCLLLFALGARGHLPGGYIEDTLRFFKQFVHTLSRGYMLVTFAMYPPL